jgi:hypothetical protein
VISVVLARVTTRSDILVPFAWRQTKLSFVSSLPFRNWFLMVGHGVIGVSSLSQTLRDGRKVRIAFGLIPVKTAAPRSMTQYQGWSKVVRQNQEVRSRLPSNAVCVDARPSRLKVQWEGMLQRYLCSFAVFESSIAITSTRVVW